MRDVNVQGCETRDAVALAVSEKDYATAVDEIIELVAGFAWQLELCDDDGNFDRAATEALEEELKDFVIAFSEDLLEELGEGLARYHMVRLCDRAMENADADECIEHVRKYIADVRSCYCW